MSKKKQQAERQRDHDDSAPDRLAAEFDAWLKDGSPGAITQDDLEAKLRRPAPER